MKRIFTLIAVVGLLVFNGQAQNVTVRIDGDNLYYNEPGCDDCNGKSDPRWRMRVWLNGSNYDWNRDKDEFCGWVGYSNYGWVNNTTAVSTAPITMQMNGYESDSWFCGGDDAVCGGYATARTVNINSYAPCTWHYFTDYRTCAVGTYGIQWSYYWVYQSLYPGSVTGGQTVCYGGNPSILGSADNGSAWMAYQWESSPNGTGSWTTISGATSNTYDPPAGITATTYYRRMGSTCGGATSVYTNIIQVIVLPVINPGTISGGGGSICSPADPAAMTVAPSGGTGTFTYQWYYKDGTSCPSTGGGTLIPGATGATYDPPAGLTTTRSYQVQVNPTGTPDCGGAIWANNCITVIVKPTPIATYTNNAAAICNNGTTNITLGSNVGGTTFTYTASGSNGNIGGYANGAGASIGQTLTNSGTSTGTVTYTITPTANGCTGAPIQTVVTVNPVPNVVATPSISAICSGAASNVALTSSVSGATYSWTATSGNPLVGGYSAASGSTIAQTLTNTGTAQGTVTYTITPTANSCSGTPSTATVNVNPLPQGSIAGSTALCSSASTNITFNFTAGTAPYDVIYTDGTNNFSLNDINSGHTVSVNPTTPTTYTLVSIIDAAGNGCTRTSGFAGSATISINPLPVGTISGATTTCAGDATNLSFSFTNGAGPFDVKYSDGTTTYSLTGIWNGHTVSVSPTNTTTYSITEITDANSCTNGAVSSSTVVTVNPLPNATLDVFTPICFGDQTTITFTFTVGTGPFDIAFTDGVTNFTRTGVNNGDVFDVTPPTSVTYNYTSITDANGCVRTSGFAGNVQVIVNPLPTVNFSGLASDYCVSGSNATLIGNQAPGGMFTGSGITDLGNGTATFSPSAAGVGNPNITYTYTDINSCVNSVTQSVNIDAQPVANAGTATDQCGLGFTFSAVPSVGQGTWVPFGGPGAAFFSNANSPGSSVQVTVYGTYIFEWREVNGECSDSEQITVTFDEIPVANPGTGGNECDLDFVFNATPSVGAGAWTQVSGPGTSSFVDATSATTTVSVSLAGQYVYQWEETNANCSDAATVTVNYYQQPVANAGFGGGECDLDFQLGATPSVGIGTWTATGPGTANFSPNANDPNAVVDVSVYGTYTFKWTENNFGCTDAASVSVQFDEVTTANAGTGGNECDLNFVLNATLSTGTGLWTATGPGNAFYSNSSSPTATATVDMYGTYIFTWTETNGNCSGTDNVTVNFYQQPVANTGSDIDACDLTTLMNATPSAGNGVWAQTNGPGTSTFADNTDAHTSVTVSQYGTYTYSWTETNGTCSSNATVLVNYYEQPVANAGTGGDACDLDFSLNGVASVGVGLWTATGPGTAAFTNDLSASTDVTVSTYGTYTFTWTEINGTCQDAASVTVNFYEQPASVTGPGGDECDLTFLTAAVPSVGTGLWSQTGGLGTATFSNAASAINLITVDLYGTYDFTWTETNGTCVDSRSMSVNFYEPPVADAGLGGDECDLDFALAANASVGNGVWTSTGPGTATFGTASSANTNVTVSQSGTYTFTWTETNGVCTDADDVVVTFYDQPVADAGVGGNECDLNFVFSAVPSFGTGTWTATGPGTASYTNDNSPTSTVTVDAYGTYTFTWTEVNGPCSDAASVTVNFYQQPVANAGTATDQCDLDFTFNGTASIGVGTWTYTGPGTATFSPNANDVNATATVDANGSYIFTWTEDNNGCTDSKNLTIVFNTLPVVSFTGLAAQYCVDQTSPVALAGTPTGGTFSGLGISGNQFIPSIAGVGTILLTYTYTDGNGCTNTETQSVDVNGIPVVSFTGLSATYCKDDATPYTLVGSPSGGTFAGAGITADQFTASVANNGTHTITYSYTDPFGCSSSEQQSVVVNELPVVSFSGLAAAYCEDAANATLTGVPAGGTFSGPGITGSTFSPLVAAIGAHTIEYTYTDGNGCTNTSAQQVTVNALPTPAITPSGTTEICAGQSITLDAGTGYTSYAWSTNQNGQSISVNAAGTYSVTVTTGAGCVATSADVTVIVNDLPVVDLGADTVICTGSALTLDAENTGLTYAWSTLEITQTITVTTTGNYTVNVTDANGCVGSDAILVSVNALLNPVIVANNPVIFCVGDSVTLDAGAGYSSYAWSTGSSNQTITVSAAGVYEVTVTDQYGCSGMDDEIVSVLQLPNAVIQPSGNIAICSADTLTLSASNTFASYQWNPGSETTSSIQVWQSGTYTVTVIDPNNGCVATSVPVVVTVNNTAAPTIVPSGDTEFCEGGSISLSVAPGPYSSFLWTSGSTTPSIVVTQTGDYAVTVVDANGCVDSTLQGNPLHVEVWNPNPQVEEHGDSLVVVNGPFVQYQWYLNGTPIPGAIAYFHIPVQSGNYRVIVWDSNDCDDSSSNIEYTHTGIADLSNLYEIVIYPNPTNGSFTLEVDFGKRVSGTVSLVDMTGRQIITPEVLSDVSSIKRKFDLENLSLGVYQLKLVTNEGVTVKSIIRN